MSRVRRAGSACSSLSVSNVGSQMSTWPSEQLNRILTSIGPGNYFSSSIRCPVGFNGKAKFG